MPMFRIGFRCVSPPQISYKVLLCQLGCDMSNQTRVVKVLAALLASMTIGAVVLMALSDKPPLAGPFSLSSYVALDPVGQAVRSQVVQRPDRWDRIEVFYGRTNAGSLEQLARQMNLRSAEDINCHFVVCNSSGGKDGRILATPRWKKQWSSIPGQGWYGDSRTIRICVITDGQNSKPTDYQVKRVCALVEALAQSFSIRPQFIHYPQNWQ